MGLFSFNSLYSGLFSGRVFFRKRILDAIIRGFESKHNLKPIEIIMMSTA